jgi:6-phosphogluconate dehydrogenase
MVHNGIEYGDMQLICEAYAMLKGVLDLSNDELYDVFAEWNRGELQSYLIEITRDIFSVKDRRGGGRPPGGQDPGHGRRQGHRQVDEPIGPGPGRAQHAGDEAVFARCLSALKTPACEPARS